MLEQAVKKPEAASVKKPDTTQMKKSEAAPAKKPAPGPVEHGEDWMWTSYYWDKQDLRPATLGFVSPSRVMLARMAVRSALTPAEGPAITDQAVLARLRSQGRSGSMGQWVSPCSLPNRLPSRRTPLR